MGKVQKKKTVSTCVMLCCLICLHTTIWWCRCWFDSTWSSSHQSGL